MLQNTTLLFDFDSTFTQVEALDVLGDIVLSGPDKQQKLELIASVTRRGMLGEVSFRQSLEKRMEILGGTRTDIEELVRILKTKVSKSITENKSFFLQHADNIYIISSGFKEFIIPVVKDFGIAPDHVYANTFVWDKNQSITGFDRANPLSQDGGKPEVVRKLPIEGKIVVIGDGYTDYEIKKAGAADIFVAFTENVNRPPVSERADFIASNFYNFLNFITNGTKTVLSQA